ncbi:MAG: hypothetical protein ABSB33_04970 [Tepidisphaeraceae bacterium]|jgi:CheY-like chemotaxis protein
MESWLFEVKIIVFKYLLHFYVVVNIKIWLVSPKCLFASLPVDTLGHTSSREGLIMTAQLRSGFRAVVLPSPDAHPQDTPTRRLLGELGHEVARAASPEHAMELINSDHTDLLVVDIAQSANRELFESLCELPESKRPDQVAVFTDSIDSQFREWRRRVAPSQVHVFLKPLHMHGLLGVLRQMERRQHAKVDA